MKAANLFRSRGPMFDSVEIIKDDSATSKNTVAPAGLQTEKAEKPVLMAHDVCSIGQRQEILATLRSKFDKSTTCQEIDDLYRAERDCLLCGPLFLTLVEPWYRRMLQKESV